MRRMVLVLGLVLTLCAWTCQAPAGTGGGDVAGPTTTGLAGLIAGEDWHYVGDGTTGLGTTFAAGWTNASAGNNLAFRIREAGVIDVQGYVEVNDVLMSDEIFALPAEYRPAGDTYMGSATVESSAGSTDGYLTAPVFVTSAGSVQILNVSVDPLYGGTAGAQYAWIFGQFFLDPATAP